MKVVLFIFYVLLGIVGVLILFTIVAAIAACMFSSMLSQGEERLEHERKQKEQDQKNEQ